MEADCRGVGFHVLVVAVVAAAWFATVLMAAGDQSSSQPIKQVTVFEDQPTSAERLISRMDGKHFAQAAVDPLYRETVDNYGGNERIASYRATRPVLGWVTWAGSLGGRRPLLAPAALAISVASMAALALAVPGLAAALRMRSLPPSVLLVFPAIVANLLMPGLAEPLGTALAIAGLTAWISGRRTLAVALFSLAGLTRETLLAVPAGLAAWEIWRSRRIVPALPLAVAPLVYGVWSMAMRWRVAPVPPEESGANTDPPFVGLIRAIPDWGVAEVLTAVSLVVAIVLVARSGHRLLQSILIFHLLVLAVLGQVVWMNWWGFGRVMLPLYVLAMIRPLVPSGTPAGSDGQQVAGGPRTAVRRRS